ncbi:MAG: IS3 family transposase [Verrucomicrobiales bacterium]|nr:IS3 family transposase [Verrucomicrobiales bacterium]
MRNQFSVVELCDALEVSRSGYYKSLSASRSDRSITNDSILKEIQNIHKTSFMNSYGSPRLTAELQKRGIECSENRVARIMAKNEIQAKHKSAFRPKTIVQDPSRKPAPNLFQGKEPSRPGEILVSDITYVATREGWLYLAITMDLFSRQVSGWHLDDGMKTEIAINALKKAEAVLPLSSKSIYHSDRGSQYTSRTMRQRLEQKGILQSMSAAGYCYDNASCESFFASLKREAFPANCVFQTKSEARRTIFEYIETFYNRTRIHTSIGNQSPLQKLNQYYQSKSNALN